MKKLLLALLLMAVPVTAVVAQFAPGQVLTATDMNNVVTTANTAQSTANTALANAATAQSTADTALASATSTAAGLTIVQTTANAALPKAGGTLTGALTGTSANFSSTVVGQTLQTANQMLSGSVVTSGITGTSLGIDGGGITKITQRGNNTSMNSILDFITLSGAATEQLGVGTTKGWRWQGRSNAFATAAQQNDLNLDYWNGSAWTSVLQLDSLTGAMNTSAALGAFSFTTPAATITTLTTSLITSTLAMSFYTASTERLRLDTSGNVINLGGAAEQGKVTTAQTTGFNYTVPANRSVVLLSHAATLASGTVTMPAAPVDGQVVRISAKFSITAFTVAPNSGQTLSGSPSTLSGGAGVGFIYDLGTTSWYRLN